VVPRKDFQIWVKGVSLANKTRPLNPPGTTPTSSRLHCRQSLRPPLLPLARPLSTGRGHRRHHTTNALDGDGLSRLFGSQIPGSRTSRRRAQDQIIGKLKRIIPRPRTVHLQVQTDVKESPLCSNCKGPLRCDHILDILLQEGDL